MSDRAEEAARMVEDCMSVISIPLVRGGPGFDEREREFIESMEDQLSDGRTPTEKQLDWLRSLWERV